MSRDGEIREIKPVTSDEWNYVRPLFFFARIILLDIIVNGNVKKNHRKEVTTIASRNVIAGSESRDKQPIKRTVKEFPA